MRDDLALDFGDTGQRLVPARFELAGDQSVGGIGSVILTEGAVGGIVRRVEIAAKSLAYLIRFSAARSAAAIDAATAPGPTTPRSAFSIASSTRSPPNAMQRGSPLSIQPRVQL